MRRARPGIGPEPVPRRTSFVPFALLSAAFARAAAASMSSACANVAPAAAANVGAATIPVIKLRREIKGVAFCIVVSSFRELCDADVGHRDLLEQVRGSDGRGRVSRQFGSELRMAECSPEVSGRFPDCIIEIRRAFAESAVKLGGDEARLALHESGVVLPSLEKGLLVGVIEREHIHQHDGAGLDRDLAFDREGGIERAQQQHGGSLSTWLHNVYLVRCNVSY